jgi:hypothetical protein
MTLWSTRIDTFACDLESALREFWRMRVIERESDYAESTAEVPRLSGLPATTNDQRLADRLAALAGLAAAIAAVAGFVPGMYRDPELVVDQSHGYDLANLIVALVLELSIVVAARGSLRARLIAIGALGCLAYSFVTYAFLIVLNPATLLYMAVLAFAGWSFVFGFTRVDNAKVQAVLRGRLARRTTACFLVILAALFGMTWLSQISAADFSGNLPAELAASGWPMNPVYVLDLGFVLPLALMTAVGLARHRPAAERIAVSFVVFVALLAMSILLMAGSSTLAGQPLQTPMIVIFVTVLAVSTAVAALALRTSPRSTDSFPIV